MFEFKLESKFIFFRNCNENHPDFYRKIYFLKKIVASPAVGGATIFPQLAKCPKDIFRVTPVFQDTLFAFGIRTCVSLALELPNDTVLTRFKSFWRALDIQSGYQLTSYPLQATRKHTFNLVKSESF